MTAMNAFARSDGAYLIADTAGYHHDGSVRGYAEKVVTDARLAMMIGMCGRVSVGAADHVERWIASQIDQPTAFARLSALLCEMVDDADESDNGDSGNLDHGIRLTVGWWDGDGGRCALMASTADLSGGAQPFEMRPLRTLFMPSLVGADPWPGHSFDPEADGYALADHQRGCDHGNGLARVGGQMILYRADANGITSRELRRWPDRIGDPIRIAA